MVEFESPELTETVSLVGNGPFLPAKGRSIAEWNSLTQRWGAEDTCHLKEATVGPGEGAVWPKEI